MGKFHLRLKPNFRGRDFIVGDLHGMFDCLRTALTERDFNPTSDRLISVGDLIDRGGDSMMCMGLLQNPWCFAVRGNHEEMMLEAMSSGERKDWYDQGGQWSDFLGPRALKRLGADIRRLPHVITLETRSGAIIGIAHAECPVDDWKNIKQAKNDPALRESIVWGRRVLRERKPMATRNVDLTIHGHTPIDAPLLLGNALFIDTGCCYGGELTLMSAEEALNFGLAGGAEEDLDEAPQRAVS
jgi:serine/threonine protein phosphatase 1